ncbi:MAG: RNA-binding transcriptional accessory protein [Chlorobi bacterium]|nr:RNA-binding transcriptional accessory protein [Chlorobiota bacterium]
MNIPQVIAEELGINIRQVNEALKLFEDGATVPFVARYRKEITGGLDEEQLRDIQDRQEYLTTLEERKAAVLESIEKQGKLTDELKARIIAAVKLREVEDLYLPYRPKRKTRGTIAKEKGLEPLADFILENPDFNGNLEEILAQYVDEEKGVNSNDEALNGAKDIIAERIGETAVIRSLTREHLQNKAVIESRKIDGAEETKGKKDVYEIYREFNAPFKQLKPHQILALNRGEKDGFLKIAFDFDRDFLLAEIKSVYFGESNSAFDDILTASVKEAFLRLIFPSIERELRNELTEKAEFHAIEIFAKNLKQLLLQPPIAGKKIIGIDPGFVSGSKVAVIDETGKYLEGETIYPHPPQNKREKAKETIKSLIAKYDAELIAIGNGTASRETETLVSELIKENNLKCGYLIVSEAGASVYSASPLAKREFPDLEASQRGNISIARRVLDPLAELVKIDPKSIGVGLYQHDVSRKLLSKKLDEVVESCVNFVGVDVNTASAPLLTYVSGLNKRLSENIVKYREEIGGFKSRKEILTVSGVGEKSFEQAAGFLKIRNGMNPLDNTFIHPESYEAVEKLMELCGVEPAEVTQRGEQLATCVDKQGKLKTAEKIGVGEPTLEDILENLKKPGLDPRDALPKPILRTDVLKIEDLSEGMKLKGTVRNVVDFGAFVDIGVKESGLLHISKITNKFIKHPIEVLNVGDIVEVTVISIDKNRGRIGLSMVD